MAAIPRGQVDAMTANSPSKSNYNPRLSPVVKLLKEVSQRPEASEVTLEKGDFKLRLRGNGKKKQKETA